MKFDTYTDLQAAIATELDRTDLAAQIPGFIRLSEAQTERQLRVRQMVASVPFTVDAEKKAVPADFLETRALYLNTNPPSLVEFDTAEGLTGTFRAPGKPIAHTVEGENFRFSPVPDSAYAATLIYYQAIPRLSVTQASNWLLMKAPDIYFYGALVNSAPYLKEDARIATWAQFYQGAIDALSVEDDRAQTAANGLKTKARTF